MGNTGEDHLLIMNYPAVSGSMSTQFEGDLETLKAVVDSFRPLQPTNAEARREEIEKQANENFEAQLRTNGVAMFGNEFAILLSRVHGWDMDDAEQRLNAVKLLQPFEAMAQLINLNEPGLNELWEALHAAEQGNALEFMKVFAEIQMGFSSSLAQEDTPAITDGDESSDS